MDNDNVIKPIGECNKGDMFRLAFDHRPSHLRSTPRSSCLIVNLSFPGLPTSYVHVTFRIWDRRTNEWRVDTMTHKMAYDEPVEILGYLPGGIAC